MTVTIKIKIKDEKLSYSTSSWWFPGGTGRAWRRIR